MARQSYSKDEKLKYVQLFAKSGLAKWEFVTQHPEIKRTTLHGTPKGEQLLPFSH